MDAMRCTKRQALPDETATPIDHCTEDIKRQRLNLGHIVLSHSLSLWRVPRVGAPFESVVWYYKRCLLFVKYAPDLFLWEGRKITPEMRGYYGRSKNGDVSPAQR